MLVDLCGASGGTLSRLICKRQTSMISFDHERFPQDYTRPPCFSLKPPLLCGINRNTLTLATSEFLELRHNRESRRWMNPSRLEPPTENLYVCGSVKGARSDALVRVPPGASSTAANLFSSIMANLVTQ